MSEFKPTSSFNYFTPQRFPHENNPIQYGRELNKSEISDLLNTIRSNSNGAACSIVIRESHTGVGTLSYGSKDVFCVVTPRFIGFSHVDEPSAEARAIVQKGVDAYLKKL
ncbi:hypothetical protein HY492_03585 [Candidatus Woesearchaeota archaeon]|nr:hypothetical protein [Candidatus Woesearchaeota archaeon]